MITKLHPYFLLLLLGTLLCGPQDSYAQNFNSKVAADIQIDDEKNDLLEVRAVAMNKTEANYSLWYELSVITSNPTSNNTSKNAQSGRFTLEPFETKDLSKTTVSINRNMKTIILLLIYNEDDELMGTSRKVYNMADKEEAQSQMSYKKKNEGIVLRGMVTDRTKTKPGKDFYGYFYQKYSLSPYQGNKIIEIDEIISFGRTTRIAVKVDDRTVYQFIAKPKLDYLKQNAETALKQVNRYFHYLRNRNESNIKY